MSENKVKWHKYPEDKPKKDGNYLIAGYSNGYIALWNINEITYDLHHSEFLEGNIMTEYESRFVAEGKPICRFAWEFRFCLNLRKLFSR